MTERRYELPISHTEYEYTVTRETHPTDPGLGTAHVVRRSFRGFVDVLNACETEAEALELVDVYRESDRANWPDHVKN